MFCLNTTLTPELEPMWLAFRSFYSAHLDPEVAGDEYVRAIPNHLRQFQISASGVPTILSVAKATESQVKRELIGWQIGRATLLIEEVYANPDLAPPAPPKEAFRDAMMRRDYSLVAGVAGRPESEIRELVDAYANWDAPYKLIAEALPVLRSSLSAEDWQGFRRYLLEVVVARQGNITEFDEFCGER